MALYESRFLDRYRFRGTHHNYDRREHAGPEYQGNILFPFAEHIFTGDRLSCLDVGSGKGEAGLHLRRYGINTTDCDISPSALRRSSSVNKTVIIVPNFPFRDDSFDAIHCKDVVAHIEHPTDMLKEFHRLLKLNGHFLLVGQTGINYSWMDVEYDLKLLKLKFSHRIKNYHDFKTKANRFQKGIIPVSHISPPYFQNHGDDLVSDCKILGFEVEDAFLWKPSWADRDWQDEPIYRFVILAKKITNTLPTFIKYGHSTNVLIKK